MSKRTKEEVMGISIPVVIVGVILVFFVRNAYRNARKEADVPDSLVVTFVKAALCAFIVITMFHAGKNVSLGTPHDTIEPGKYDVVAVIKDEALVTDSNSHTLLLLTRGGRAETEFYSLPTNNLQGDPLVGGTLEITEIPLSQKMVFHKR